MSKHKILLAFGLFALVLLVQLFRVASAQSDPADCAQIQAAYVQQTTAAYAQIPRTTPGQKAALDQQMQIDLAKDVCAEHMDDRGYAEQSMAAWSSERSTRNTVKHFLRRLFR